jgi:Protein of unknown function (DUF3108)
MFSLNDIITKRHPRMVMFTAWILIFVFLLKLFILLPEVDATKKALPFQIGEYLLFHIYWGFIKVGETVMEVLPNTTVDGQLARHFRLKTRTTPFIDMVYKVRSEIEAFTDMDMSRSVLYKKKHTEGGDDKDIVVTFDWVNHKAAYLNFGEQEKDTKILPGTFDPLGILYSSRTVDYSEVKEFERPVTDGKKCVIGRLSLLGRERIKLHGVHYDTYVMKPDMKDIEGFFEENPDAQLTLWFKADHSGIPVKIKIEVLIGSIVCRLVPASGK